MAGLRDNHPGEACQGTLTRTGSYKPGLRTERKGFSIRRESNADMNQAEGRSRDLRGDIAFAFGLAVACYVAWLLRNVLLLLYVSALAAVVLTPLVRATSRFRSAALAALQGTRHSHPVARRGRRALTAFGFLAFPPVIRDLHEFTSRDADAIACFSRQAQAHSVRRPGQYRRDQRPRSRISSAMQPPTCCFRSRTGRARSSASRWV